MLSYFLFAQPSVPKAGFYGLIAALVASAALFPEFRNRRRIWSALVDAGRMAASIVVIVTAIGLIVGLIQTSGFAGRLSLLPAQVASGPLPVVLLVVAFGATVLGMGLPPGATYFIIVIALSSGIDTIGIAPLTLHFFVVVFAMMSTVTPPVALAAFAAAPIAGANPIRTGFEAARIAFAGFDRGPLRIPERVLRIALGVLAFFPQSAIAAPAALAGVILIALSRVRHRSVRAAQSHSPKASTWEHT